jgi:hypothetical protein
MIYIGTVLFYYHSYKCMLCNAIITIEKRFCILHIWILHYTLVSILSGLTDDDPDGSSAGLSHHSGSA